MGHDNHIDTAKTLDKVVGGKWEYKPDRGLYECKPMPFEIAMEIGKWLHENGITVKEGRAGVWAVPQHQMILAISEEQPISNLSSLRHEQITILEHFCQKHGILVADSQHHR